MYKARIKDKLWFSQCGRTWLVCRKPSPNPIWTLLVWLYMQIWAKNSSPNTNDLYMYCMDKSTGTTTSLEEKKALQSCGNKDGNIINVLKTVFTPLLQQFWGAWNDCTHMSLVFGDEFLAQGLHLKSHQKWSAEIRTWLQVLPHWLNHNFSLILVLYTRLTVMLE